MVVLGTGQLDLCIIRLADCAFVLVLRAVLEERWRAGGACLRPNNVRIFTSVVTAVYKQNSQKMKVANECIDLGDTIIKWF